MMMMQSWRRRSIVTKTNFSPVADRTYYMICNSLAASNRFPAVLGRLCLLDCVRELGQRGVLVP